MASQNNQSRQQQDRPLPKFGEWDVNDPASAEGFTVIFAKARDDKKTNASGRAPSQRRDNNKGQDEPTRTNDSCRFVLRFQFQASTIIKHVN
ncbi:hypothetical protein Bca52824_081943 [Brassica carinata]|uniref:RIN4 pathogenic type III effector avirulence factor Avr cleavage site domain-containing protein n=1 Tax=Brassica carinata TaxID=52824 RepID=A0A8X7TRQ3_BRACI|nr:hypothetical protein Bca52824_081943 [Brassica carinata]